LDSWIHSVIFGAEAEFAEKATDQKPVVSFSPVGTGRAPGFVGQQSEQIYRGDGHVQMTNMFKWKSSFS
jgi:hypothetical protein